MNSVTENNHRLIGLYADYLNYRPDFVSADMVREIASLGGLTEDEAFLILFAEALGVHPTDGAEDEVFFRDWIVPSVRHLDAGRYRNDPYYKNIRIPSVTEGSWELKRETWQPWQAFIWDDLHLLPDGRVLPPLGYFSESFDFPAVLQDGREWMMVTPNEVETIRPAVNASAGKVITFGLGLGYYAYMASEKPEVGQVTVVEKDESVIRLFRDHILPQFTYPEKIRVICADAFEYAETVLPGEDYSLAFADTWHDALDGVPMYRRFKALEPLTPQTRFLYWVENTLLEAMPQPPIPS